MSQIDEVVISERIVCAANQHLATKHLLIGVRHWDGFMHNQKEELMAAERYGWVASEQGFINQKGEFLSRVEAWKVAEAAGQIIRRVGGDTADGGTLYSENLY